MYLTPILYHLLLVCSIGLPSVRSAFQDDEVLHPRSFVAGPWDLVQQGTTGVSAMQMMVVSETKAVILDKIEHNPLTTSNGSLVWVVELDLETKQPRALNPLSNTFCATGSFLSNGTMVSTGGTAMMFTGDLNGLQGMRLFTPCTDASCDILETPDRIRLTSNRWYPSSVRLEDGSILIFGGAITGGLYINSPEVSNPTYEFFPPKNIHGFNGLQIPSQFLVDTLNANLFPILIELPDGNIFIAANQAAIIFSWKTNTETPLPKIPNGVRIASPFSAGAVLLPLTPENNYTPEVMICGGSTIDDKLPKASVSPETPASNQCNRLVLTPAGIRAGWKVETMPQNRVMGELILLPDGRVVVVNGAMTGVAGLSTDLGNGTIQIEADNPASMPAVYDPHAPIGQRFTQEGIPASPISRVYHSTSSLTPNGTIMLAGSNPNTDVSTTVEKFPTEYRLEFYSPPYMAQPRPSYSGLPVTIDYGAKFTLHLSLPPRVSSVSVSLMDLGFATHGVHMDQRLVKLRASLSADKKSLSVVGPPTARIYPPGPAFLFVVTDGGVPSFGHKTIIGTGSSPPVDEDAITNMLSHTPGPSTVPAPGNW